MRSTLLSSLALSAALASSVLAQDTRPLTAPSAPEAATTTYRIKIGLFPGYTLSRDNARRILDEVTRIIENADGGDDIDCKPIRFELDGNPQTYQVGLPQVIDSASALDAFGRGAQSVYVVESIP